METINKTKYIAHRGFGHFNLENTLKAFKFAGQSNVYGIETDVQRTLDGEYIIFHDDSTLRLTGKDLVIEDTSYSELKKLTFLNQNFIEQKIPTLQEYLDICKNYDKVAVIEIK